MPFRYFKCEQCKIEEGRIYDAEKPEVLCKNGHAMEKLPFRSVSNIEVTEKLGKYWNKNLKVGIKEQMQERSREHMREHEMHDIIARHGIKNLRNHPLIKDGRIRRKGE